MRTILLFMFISLDSYEGLPYKTDFTLTSTRRFESVKALLTYVPNQ